MGVLVSVLPAAVVVRILYLLLQEQSIIICGPNSGAGLVSAVATACLHLLKPLTWAGIFVPVLPQSAAEILQAPVPFIAGTMTCPRRDEISGSAAILYLDDFMLDEASSPDGVEERSSKSSHLPIGSDSRPAAVAADARAAVTTAAAAADFSARSPIKGPQSSFVSAKWHRQSSSHQLKLKLKREGVEKQSPDEGSNASSVNSSPPTEYIALSALQALSPLGSESTGGNRNRDRSRSRYRDGDRDGMDSSSSGSGPESRSLSNNSPQYSPITDGDYHVNFDFVRRNLNSGSEDAFSSSSGKPDSYIVENEDSVLTATPTLTPVPSKNKEHHFLIGNSEGQIPQTIPNDTRSSANTNTNTAIATNKNCTNSESYFTLFSTRILPGGKRYLQLPRDEENGHAALGARYPTDSAHRGITRTLSMYGSLLKKSFSQFQSPSSSSSSSSSNARHSDRSNANLNKLLLHSSCAINDNTTPSTAAAAAAAAATTTLEQAHQQKQPSLSSSSGSSALRKHNRASGTSISSAVLIMEELILNSTDEQRSLIHAARSAIVAHNRGLCGDVESEPLGWRSYGAVNGSSGEFEYYPEVSKQRHVWLFFSPQDNLLRRRCRVEDFIIVQFQFLKVDSPIAVLSIVLLLNLVNISYDIIFRHIISCLSGSWIHCGRDSSSRSPWCIRRCSCL
jgi:hypothetical protein